MAEQNLDREVIFENPSNLFAALQSYCSRLSVILFSCTIAIDSNTTGWRRKIWTGSHPHTPYFNKTLNPRDSGCCLLKSENFTLIGLDLTKWLRFTHCSVKPSMHKKKNNNNKTDNPLTSRRTDGGKSRPLASACWHSKLFKARQQSRDFWTSSMLLSLCSSLI